MLVVNCEKLPWVPFRSGVAIAESILPSNFSGGKVMGTRRMVEPIPWFPRIVQKGWLFRRNSMGGRDSGMRKRPRRSTRSGWPTRAEESRGWYDFRLRSRKSKMLWRAGLTPVANVDQATGERAGKVVRSLL